MSPPSPYFNLVFPVGQSSYYFNNCWIQSPQIEGVTLKPSCSTYLKGTKMVGVRFYPYGLASFLDISPKEILNKTAKLSFLLSESEYGFLNRIAKAKNDKEILSSINNLLSKRFKKNYQKNKLVIDCYHYFKQAEQFTTIESFIRQYGTNYRTLNRYFSTVVGISTKKFERLIKFRKSLCSLTTNSERLTTIGVDAGYFDQSHFVREFKLFMNYKPSAFYSLINTATEKNNQFNYNFTLY
ncbi:helix-turn-helix domain-containing protein [Xanthovirga aplysinae]|uniref:helix-turn-helix domain-containing protein n=1 Tax=Xanthovirga aplysinae TaxID=2529853 RepID=UPI0012BC42C8|nr:helix-turn-helix domain-containing protein [Xanthovirga aplysinae]MTI32088.1 AraC family transcriptional regulator [Xanthovirga aplysinae]